MSLIGSNKKKISVNYLHVMNMTINMAMGHMT